MDACGRDVERLETHAYFVWAFLIECVGAGDALGRHPGSPHGGSVYTPKEGKTYFDELE